MKAQIIVIFQKLNFQSRKVKVEKFGNNMKIFKLLSCHPDYLETNFSHRSNKSEALIFLGGWGGEGRNATRMTYGCLEGVGKTDVINFRGMTAC